MRFRRLLKHQLQRLKSIRTTGRSPGASFLSLPTELRFQIYDIVKDFDLKSLHRHRRRQALALSSPPTAFARSGENLQTRG
jgi:hypothetical protein